MGNITYGDMDEWAVNNEFEKISNVFFDSKYSENANDRSSLKHEFEGWALSPNGDIIYRVGQVISLKDDEIGNLTLYAIWSTEYITLPSLDRTGYTLVAWTSDKEGFTIAGDVSSNYPITSNTTVYAKWNLIQYTINYNGNGYTSGSTADISGRLHSAETSYQLAMNGYTRTGYHFAGWNTKADGTGTTFTDGATVSYIDTEKDSVVTLYAQWDENEYDIVFNINVPSIANSSSYKGKASGTMSSLEKCLYDTNVVLTKNKFAVEGWIFKGWATSATGNTLYLDGSTQKNLAPIDGAKVNLYAVWEVDPYTIGKYVVNGAVVSGTAEDSLSYAVYNDIQNTPKLTLNDCQNQHRIVVDWSRYEGVQNCKNYKYGTYLDIHPYSMEDVYFLGNSKAQYTDLWLILTNPRPNNEITLHFSDFNMVGFIHSYQVYDNNDSLKLTLDCRGKNSITASSGTIAIGDTDESVDIGYLTVTGAGTLTVNGAVGTDGANGADATTAGGNGGDGKNGGNGTIGIAVDNLIVDMTGTLVVRGGDGGNGGNGGAGKQGENGQDGGAGGIGADGGSGAAAVTSTMKIVVRSGNAFLLNGSGGNGGNGGKGAIGSKGADGASYYYQGTTVMQTGQPGDPGGNGGRGGNGGNGGKAQILAFATEPSTNDGATLLIFNGSHGNGGNGGTGGNGGDGGTGGSCYYRSQFLVNKWYHGGKGGDGGYGGHGGNGGSGNVAGTPGAGGFGGAGGIQRTDASSCACKGPGTDRRSVQSDGGAKGTSYGSNTSQYNGGIITSTDLFADGTPTLATYYSPHYEIVSSTPGNPTGLNYEFQSDTLDSGHWHCGGYSTKVGVKADTTYYYVFCAKIPKDLEVIMIANQTGQANGGWSSAAEGWITSNKGTGEYEWYIGYVQSWPDGLAGGVFSDLGYVSLKGSHDVTWSVAYHAIVECPN